MKKAYIFILIFALLLSNFSYAAPEEQEKKRLEFTTIVDVEDMNEDYYKIFDVDINEIPTNEDLNIEYDYNFTYIDENHVNISINGSINSSKDEHIFKASGIIEKYILETGEHVYFGSADGTIYINSEDYNFTLGFDKKNYEEFITTTIYNETLQTVLVFGKPVVSIEEKNRIIELQENILDEQPNQVPNILAGGPDYNNDFISLRSKSGNLYDNAGTETRIRGVTLYLYKSDYDVTAPALQIQVRSYIDSIYDSLKAGNPYITSVKLNQIKVSLDMTVGSCDNSSPSPSDEGSGILKSILLDALGIYGVPTGTLDAIFSTLRGSVAVKYNSYTPQITITANTGGSIDCDSEYLPLFFTVDTNRYDEIDGSFEGDLKYAITTHNQSVGSFTFYQHATASGSIATTF